jgi:hypothetical protein
MPDPTGSVGSTATAGINVRRIVKWAVFVIAHFVFHRGCDLFNNCHPSGEMDGKTKNLYPRA